MARILVLILACSLHGQILLPILAGKSGAAPPFDPTQLSGIQFDYRANFGNDCGGSACTNNANHDTWTDKSSNANNLSYAGSACASFAHPSVYHTNRTPAGTPAITFGGAGGVWAAQDCMVFGTSVNLTGGSVSMCVVTEGASTAMVTQAVVTGPSGAFQYEQSRSTLQGAAKADIAVLGAGTTAIANPIAWHLACVTYNNTTLNFYLDGASDGTTSVSNTITANETTVGANPLTPFEGYVGDVAEIFGTNTILSGTDLTNIHSWAVAQYGTP